MVNGQVNALIQMYLPHYIPLVPFSIPYSRTTEGHTRRQKANTQRYSHADTDPGIQRVNKRIPGIKGHVSGECVCGRFAKEEAYAPVEAVSVCAGGRGGCGGGQRALLQQGQGVGRAVAQRVGATAQLLATVRVDAVHQTI